MSHPYRKLPDERFWRRAVAGLPPAAIDPVIAAPFTIRPTDRIATAGSCFALQIAASLREAGLNYYVVEAAPDGVSADEASARNFGAYSCRYGNIYTVRHLRQLVDRAYGRFQPSIDAWLREDGKLIDPFRPLIEPDGFESLEALHADRARHLAAVRRMLATLDIFIFTLGLTEFWHTRADGAALPLPPGAAGSTANERDYAFSNLRARDVADDFLAFARELSAVNRKAKIILTVSPVSIIATFEPRHVLVSNSASKAILRASVEDILAERPDIAYFPSYDIVTSPATLGRFYADNLRNLTPGGIAVVMRLFFRHFVEGRREKPVLRFDAAREAEELAQAACDEDALDPRR
jgi:hypothetical protein